MKNPIAKIFTYPAIIATLLFVNTLSAGAAARHTAADTVKVQTYPEKSADISPLLIGEAIPTVNLPAANGQLYNLNTSLGQQPTILIFYRGGWCPFCNKELAGIQAIQAELLKMGYQIVAISTDSPENLSKSKDQHQLSYTLLSDADLAISKQFGIAFKAPAAYSKTLADGSNGKNVDKLLPVPSVFILDKKGVIQFEYINPDFKQRISPDLLIAVAAALNKPVKTP